MAEDFSIVVGARLNETDLSTIDTQIKDLGKDKIELHIGDDIKSEIKTLSQALKELSSTNLNLKNVKGLDISKLINVNSGAIRSQAQKVGQEYGRVFSDTVEQAIKLVSSTGIGETFSFNTKDSETFKKQITAAVKEWTKGSGKLVDAKVTARNVYNEEAKTYSAELERLFVTYKNEENAIIKKVFGREDTESGSIFREFSTQYSKSIEKELAEAQKIQKEIEDNYSKYTTSLEKLKANNPNVAIDDESFQIVLNNYKEGRATINELKSAFAELEIQVQSVGKSLNSQKSSFNVFQQALNNMRNFDNSLGELKTNIDGLSDSSKDSLLKTFQGLDSNVENIDAFIEKLKNAHTELQNVLNSNGGKIPSNNTEWGKNFQDMMTQMVTASDKVKALQKVEAADNSETTRVNAAYKEMLSLLKEIGNAKLKISGLDENKDVEQINNLTSKIKEWEQEYNRLLDKGFLKFNDSQIKSLISEASKIDDAFSLNSSKQVDKLRDSLKKNLLSFNEKNNGFDSFTLKIDEADVSLKSLLSDLKETNTIDGLSNIASQAEKLKTAFTEDQAAVDKMSQLKKEFNDIGSKLITSDLSDGENIADLKKQLDSKVKNYDYYIKGYLNENSKDYIGNKISTEQIADFYNYYSQLSTVAQETKAKLTESLNVFSAENTGFSVFITEIDKTLTSINGLKQAISQLPDEIKSIDDINSFDNLRQKIETFTSAFTQEQEKATSAFESMLSAQKEIESAGSGLLKTNLGKGENISNLTAELKNALKEYNKFHEQFYGSDNTDVVLLSELVPENLKNELKTVKGEIAEIFKSAKTGLIDDLNMFSVGNNGFSNFKMQIDGAEVSVEEFKQKIRDLPNEINSVDDIKIFNKLRQQAEDFKTTYTDTQNSAAKAANEAQKKTNEAYKEMLSLQKEENRMKLEAQKLDETTDAPTIAEYEKQISALGEKINKLLATNFSNLTESQFKAFKEVIESTNNELDLMKAKLESIANKKAATALEKIQNQTKKVFDNLKDYASKNTEFEKFLTGLENGKYSMKGFEDEIKSIDTEEKFKAYKEQIEKIQKAFTDSVTLENIKKSVNYGDNTYGDKATEINVLENKFKKLGLSAEQIAEKMKGVRSALEKVNEAIGNNNVDEATSAYKKLNEELKKANNDYKLTSGNPNATYNATKQANLFNSIQTWLAKNTAATKEARAELQGYLDDMSEKPQTDSWLNNVTAQFKRIKSESTVLGKIGKSFTDQFKQGFATLTSWFSASQAVMTIINKTTEAINELKEVDTYITEISKANDSLTDEQLKSIASNSFDVAGKYGKSSTDYLAAVQEMSRAGYKDAEGLSELSVAAQGAGDMTADLANQYIIATDKAYGFEGSVEALTSVLDGANYITNNNAVNMTELAEGMSIVGSQAASSGLEVDETTAALATMIAVTQQGGSQMANAFKGILMNIQQVTGEVDGEEIDTDSLTKYEKACADLGVALSEVKDGVVSLRDPMTVIKELSDAYTALDESDAKRVNLLSSVGGKTYLYVQKCA